MSDRKFDDFDGFAIQYRANHTDNINKENGVDSNYFSEYKVKEVWQSENNNQNCVILDFGCADGNSAQNIFEYLSASSYYGIDISTDSIEVATQHKLERCNFQVFSGERIPVNDASFDTVFIAGVLHHVNIEYRNRILSECYRVMKKGGGLYIFEHDHINPITRKIVKDCKFDIDAELVPHLVRFERYLQWCPLGGQYYVKCYK
jgi:ubiquinone/menaquinone biosynthesis C-methylase UbiE